MDGTYYEFDLQGDVELLIDPNQETLLAKGGYVDSKVTSEKVDSKDQDNEVSETSEGDVSTDAAVSNSNDAKPTEKLRIRVSSKVLSLASPYFMRMLQGEFKEAQDLRSGHLVQVNTENCGTKALLILLSIFHTCGHEVPESIDFETAFELASLIDMWLCHDATKFHIKIWASRLCGIWESPLHNLHLWVFIAFTFDEKKLFKEATARLIREASDDTKIPLSVHIPECIIQKINADRIALLSAPVHRIYESFNSHGSQARCHPTRDRYFSCSCANLGDLVKIMWAIGLPLDYSKQPAEPFVGLTVAHLVGILSDQGRKNHQPGAMMPGPARKQGTRTIVLSVPTSFGLELQDMM